MGARRSQSVGILKLLVDSTVLADDAAGSNSFYNAVAVGAIGIGKAADNGAKLPLQVSLSLIISLATMAGGN